MKDHVNPNRPQMADKILELDELADAVAKLQQAGHTVVHCHGVFDLVHPGHIRHLEAAARLGDKLLVTLTADRFVNKGPGRPVFNAQLRAETLAALGCVALVGINDAPNAVELITKLHPDVYAKGSDYKNLDDDVTGMIAEEKKSVEAHGGVLSFTNELTMSSSELINTHFEVFSPEAQDWLTGIRQKYSISEVTKYLDEIRSLNVLVIGEAIIDEYHFCESLGKSAKDPILAFKYLAEETYIGGSLAIANHVAGLCNNVGLLALVGDADNRSEYIRDQLMDNVDFHPIGRRGTPTIHKRRYVDSHTGGKLFELYELDDALLDGETETRLLEEIDKVIDGYDVVIMADYGHGMMTPDAIAQLIDRSSFLAVNTQANAGNRGFNTISKYERADYICLNGGEVQLEMRMKQTGFKDMIGDLRNQIQCDRYTVTRGRAGSLHFDPTEGFVEAPALAIRVTDRVGAGDAVLAVTSPLVAQGTPWDIIAFLTNLAGAEMVAELGTSRSIDRAVLAKHVSSIMK